MSQPLTLLPAHVQAEMIASAEISATEVLEAHLNVIEEENPRINAICTLNVEAARAKAAMLDDLTAQGQSAGPLHGLVVGIKDTHLTKSLRTTFGSPIYRDLIPNQNHRHVELIEQAGAVVIGKTNVPEFAAGSQTTNPVFGATHNPYDISKTVGGSSGGAAGALATGMVALADGSDMGGSLRNPASFCNVFGLRPTPGCVPDIPSKEPWNNLSVIGPMARNAKDLGLLLSVMAQWDARDPLSRKEAHVIYHPGNWEHGDIELRIAVSQDLSLFPLDAEVQRLFHSCVTGLEQAGLDLTWDEPDLAAADNVFRVLRSYSFAGRFENEYFKSKELLKQDIVSNIELGRELSGVDVYKARAAQGQLFNDVLSFLENYDVLLIPTVQVLPFSVGEMYPPDIDGNSSQSYIDWMASCFLLSVLNMPVISVPVSFSETGLPFGVQILAKPGSELSLLMLAERIDQIFGMSQRTPY